MNLLCSRRQKLSPLNLKVTFKFCSSYVVPFPKHALILIVNADRNYFIFITAEVLLIDNEVIVFKSGIECKFFISGPVEEVIVAVFFRRVESSMYHSNHREAVYTCIPSIVV